MGDNMQALVLRGDWDPKDGYVVSRQEQESGKATCASAVWRNPKITLEHQPVPRIADDEVLLKVKACGVCGSDTHCFETDPDGYVIFSGPVKLPVIMGHEYSGEVVEVGRAVTTLKVGDPVAPEGMLWCGVCRPCRTGHPNQCRHLEMVGFSSPGAFAEYIAVKEKYCWKLDDLRQVCNSDQEMYEIGALIEPIGCSYNGMFVSAGGFLPGAHVAVFGAGPIGLGAVLMARAAGAARIVVFDVVDQRCNLAVEMGADAAYNPIALAREGTSPHEIVMDITDGHGADMLVEAAGAAPHTVPEIEQSYAPNGKMVYLGRAATAVEAQLDVLVSNANSIAGARGHAGYGIFPNIIRMLATGRIPAAKMITARYPFAQVLDALERSTTRTDGKIMVRFS